MLANVIGNFIGGSNLGGILSAASQPALYTLFGSNLVYGPDFSYLKNMLQESALDGTDPIARTAVTATNDSVGTIYDVSDNALLTLAAANARRPTLVSKVGNDAWLNFSDAGADQYAVIDNSTKIFNFLTASNPVGTIAFLIDASTLVDGTIYYIVDSIAGSAGGGRSGISVRRTNTGNKFIFQMAQGGSSKISFTSSFTMNAAAGIVSVIISLEGTVTGLKVYFNDLAAETGTISAGSDNLVNFANLNIGMPTGSSSGGLNAAISKLTITKNVWTSDQRTAWKAYSGTRNTTQEIYRTFRKIDTNDNSLMFENSNASIAVTDGDRVRLVKTKNRAIGATGDELMRDWLAPLFFIDLTGTGGSCTVTIDGVVLTATFATSLYQTSVNFRTNGTNATNLITLGLFVREQSNQANTVLGRINFYPLRAGVAEPAVVNIANVSGDLNGTQSDTKRAIWDADAFTGSKGALLFAEADYTNYIMTDLGTELGGKWTKGFKLFYNPADTADVGHFSIGNISGTDRGLLTGPNYSGNSSITGATGNGYFVWHGSSDVFGDGAILPLQWNEIIVQRNGINCKTYINGVLIEDANTATNMSIKMLYRGCSQVGDQTTAGKNQWEGWMGNTVEIQGICPISYIQAQLS